MRVIKSYACEVCGFMSNDRMEVERCESLGRKNKFKDDDKVVLIISKIFARDTKRFPGRIAKSGVSFTHRRHDVFYRIDFTEENKKAVIDYMEIRIGRKPFIREEHDITKCFFPEDCVRAAN